MEAVHVAKIIYVEQMGWIDRKGFGFVYSKLGSIRSNKKLILMKILFNDLSHDINIRFICDPYEYIGAFHCEERLCLTMDNGKWTMGHWTKDTRTLNPDEGKQQNGLNLVGMGLKDGQ